MLTLFRLDALYWQATICNLGVASPHFTTVLVKCRTYIFAYWLNFKARGQWDTLTRNRNTLIQGFFTFCFDQGEKQTFPAFNNWVKLLVLLSLEYVSWFFTWNRSTQMFVITSWIHLNLIPSKVNRNLKLRERIGTKKNVFSARTQASSIESILSC